MLQKQKSQNNKWFSFFALNLVVSSRGPQRTCSWKQVKRGTCLIRYLKGYINRTWSKFGEHGQHGKHGKLEDNANFLDVMFVDVFKEQYISSIYDVYRKC